MVRGGWWPTVYGVTETQTRLRDFLHFIVIKDAERGGHVEMETKMGER